MKRIAILISICASSGCALLSKSEPTTPRYFNPVPPAAASSASGAEAVKAGPGLELRLGGVTAGDEIRQSLAVRSSNHELTYSRDQRWTEQPEAYLRRALASALFERRGLRRIISGPGPTLEVELIAFEEVAEPRCARASVVVVLRDDRLVRLESTITVERKLTALKGGPEASVEALSLALTELVGQVVDQVTARLMPPTGLVDR